MSNNELLTVPEFDRLNDELESKAAAQGIDCLDRDFLYCWIEDMRLGLVSRDIEQLSINLYDVANDARVDDAAFRDRGY